MRKFTLVFMVFLLIIFNTIAMSKEEAQKRIYTALLKINFDEVVQNICDHGEKQICNVLKDKRINSYLRKYWRPAMYTIAQQESQFIARIGKYDKNDVSHFQINMRYWSPLKIYKKFGIRTSKYELYHIPEKAAYVATHIWLYNVAYYISVFKKYPRSISEYAALYHKVAYISKPYKKRIEQKIYKNINLFD